jgi:HD-GYP domain-containing protein (c-di-GMP phosphodiesterase class II)
MPQKRHVKKLERPAAPPQVASQASAAPALDISGAIGRIQGLEAEIARVIQDMHEKVQQLEYLNEFSALLNSSLDTAVVREKALEATCRLLRCETASLYLVDEKARELYWETALGDVGKELQRSVRLPIDDRSIAGYVALTGESLVVNDVENDPRHFKKVKEGGFRTRTMVCVPLVRYARAGAAGASASDVQTIGVLQALNKSEPRNAFSDDDRRLLETLSHQVAIAVDNSRLYGSIKKNFFNTVEALAEAIEKKDRYTGGHTKRVVYYSMCIAKYLDLSPERLEELRWGAVLHDIGKIGVEDKILKKQAPLESEEWKVMQRHPEFGWDIMNRVEGLGSVIDGMRFHHERWDGRGYPSGLKGEQIPFIARVIAVADTYDAMVSTRPYRKGLDPQFARAEIEKHSGTQFDPRVVRAFLDAFQKEKMGKGSGGSALSNCD